MYNRLSKEHYSVAYETDSGKFRVHRNIPRDSGHNQITVYKTIRTIFAYDYQSQAIDKAKELAFINNINYILP